jgi:predicted transcriptional regulator
VRRLGELEAVVMDRLWGLDGCATVREVYEQLQEERRIAYTTVMSTMDNLHRKGLLEREREGRAYRYRALTSRAGYRAELMRQALGGDAETEAVLAHFVGQLSQDERRRLRTVLQRRADDGRRL